MWDHKVTEVTEAPRDSWDRRGRWVTMEQWVTKACKVCTSLPVGLDLMIMYLFVPGMLGDEGDKGLVGDRGENGTKGDIGITGDIGNKGA